MHRSSDSRPREHFRPLATLRRWLLLGALVALAAALIACEEDDGDAAEDAAQDADPPVNQLEITVGDEGLSPDEEEVRIPDRYQLVVNNESGEDCSFYLGTFVRALEVPAGETAEMDVQLPPSASGENAPGGEELMEMGCDGDEERQGTLVVLTATGSDLGVD